LPGYFVMGPEFQLCHCLLGHTIAVKPNTHRRRDASVELSQVGVGGVNTIRSQLAHDDCRRIRPTIWKLNIAV